MFITSKITYSSILSSVIHTTISFKQARDFLIFGRIHEPVRGAFSASIEKIGLSKVFNWVQRDTLLKTVRVGLIILLGIVAYTHFITALLLTITFLSLSQLYRLVPYLLDKVLNKTREEVLFKLRSIQLDLLEREVQKSRLTEQAQEKILFAIHIAQINQIQDNDQKYQRVMEKTGHWMKRCASGCNIHWVELLLKVGKKLARGLADVPQGDRVLEGLIEKCLEFAKELGENHDPRVQIAFKEICGLIERVRSSLNKDRILNDLTQTRSWVLDSLKMRMQLQKVKCQEQFEDQAFPFLDLPDDLKWQIYRRLPTRELLNLDMTSKKTLSRGSQYDNTLHERFVNQELSRLKKPLDQVLFLSSSVRARFMLQDLLRAQEITKAISDQQEKSEAERSIVRAFCSLAEIEKDHLEKAEQWLTKAQEIANTISDPDQMSLAKDCVSEAKNSIVQTLCDLAKGADNLEKAEQWLTKAQEIANTISDPDRMSRAKDVSVTKNSIVRAFCDLAKGTDNLEKAEQWLTKAQEIAHTISDPDWMSRARVSIVQTFCDLAKGVDNLEMAEQWLTKAQEIANTISDPYWMSGAKNCVSGAKDSIVQTFCDLAKGVDNLEKAEQWLTKAQEIANTISDPDWMSRAKNCVSIAKDSIVQTFCDLAKGVDNLEKAEQWLIKVQEISNPYWMSVAKDCVSIAKDSIVQTFCDLAKGVDNLEKAEQWLKKSQEIANTISNPYWMSSAKDSIVRTFCDLAKGVDNLEKAEQWLKKSQEIANTISDPYWMSIIQTFCDLAKGVDNLEKAEQWLTKAQEIANTISNPYWMSTAKDCVSIAKDSIVQTFCDLAKGVDNLEKAEQWLKKAQEIANTISDPDRMCTAKDSIVRTFCDLAKGVDNLEKAEQWLKKAQEIANTISNPYWMSIAKDSIVQTFCDLAKGVDNLEKAEQWLKKAQEIANTISDPYWMSIVQTFCDLAKGVDNLEKAEQWLTKAQEIANTISDPDRMSTAKDCVSIAKDSIVQTFCDLAKGVDNLEKAEQWLTKVQEIANTISDPVWMSSAKYSIVRTFCDLAKGVDNLEKSEQWLTKAQEIANTISDPVWQSFAKNSIARE